MSFVNMPLFVLEVRATGLSFYMYKMTIYINKRKEMKKKKRYRNETHNTPRGKRPWHILPENEIPCINIIVVTSTKEVMLLAMLVSLFVG